MKTRLLILLYVLGMVALAVISQELEIDPDQEVNYNNHFGEQHNLAQQQRRLEIAAEYDHIILRAVSQHNVDWMLKILDRDPAAVNANNLQGWNALMYATVNDFPDMVHELIHRGADPNQVENDFWTPIMFAAFQGKEDLIPILADAGTDLLHRNKEGLTAHELARAQAHDRVARFLGERTIIQAISKDQGINVIMHHIQLGINPNIANSQGWTPLIYASAKGFEVEAPELIALGAVVDLPENDGWTPLMFAANNGFDNLVQLYLSLGANIDHMSANNRSAYTQAKEHQFDKVLEILDNHRRTMEEKDHTQKNMENNQNSEMQTGAIRNSVPPEPIPASSLSTAEEKKKKGFLGFWN